MLHTAQIFFERPDEKVVLEGEIVFEPVEAEHFAERLSDLELVYARQAFARGSLKLRLEFKPRTKTVAPAPPSAASAPENEPAPAADEETSR